MKIFKYIGLTVAFMVSWFVALVAARIIEILVLKHPVGHAGKGHVFILAAAALLANICIWAVAAIAYARLGRWWRKLPARRRVAVAKKAEKVATVVMFFGVVCFLLSFVMTRPLPAYIRPPLTSISDVAVDSSGLIYCSRCTDRHNFTDIQVYTPQGRYFGTFRPGGADGFVFTSMKIDRSDRICLADDHTRKVFVFDKNGHHLGSHRYPDGCNHIASNEEFKDKAGNVYSFSPIPMPSIWKTDSSGKTSIVIIDPPYLWFVYPAAAFFMIIAGRVSLGYFRGLG